MNHSLTIAVFAVFCAIFTPIAILAQAQGGFISPITGSVNSIAIEENGKIIVVEDRAVFFPVAGGERNVYRLHPDGRKDLTFTGPTAFAPCPPLCSSGPGGRFWPSPGGKLLWSFPTPSGNPLRRLNSDGSADTVFNPVIKIELNPVSNTAGVNKVIMLPDGQMYIIGGFDTVNGVRMRGVAKLNPDGSLDTTFADPQVGSSVGNIVMQPDGKLLISGQFSSVGGTTIKSLARLNPNGTLDTSFVPPNLGTNAFVWDMDLFLDGKIMFSGQYTITAGQQTYQNLARLNSSGSLDPTFVLAPEDKALSDIREMVIQPDGKIVVLNAADRYEPFGSEDYTRWLVKRFNPDGSRDNSIQAIPVDKNSSSGGLALQMDGAILAGNNRGLKRIGLDGKLDVPFARFDFDGNKRADLAVFRPSNRRWYIHTGTTYSVSEFGAETDRPVPADYDGDARTDIAVYRESNGTWYWINSSNSTFSYQQWGVPGDIAMPGMAETSRRALFEVYRPSNATWYRLTVNNGVGSIQRWQIGTGAGRPLPFHVVGTAGTTPTVYETTANGLFFTYNATTLWTDTIGQPGDVPVLGDFDGDLKGDLAVFRPETGQWTIRQSTTNTIINSTWGQPGDVPVPADYDGDQQDDIAVWRPSTGTWYIIGSTEGWRIQQFGQAGDIPIPSSYLYGN